MTTATRADTASPAAGLDVSRLREDFPILRQTVHGKPLVYLDNAATTQKPKAVLDALMTYYGEDNANVHRGVHVLSERATQVFEDARATVARFINAASTREVVFTRNATEGVNLVAQTFGRTRLGPGDEVVISAMEHHSNIVPWQMVCRERGATLRVIPIDRRWCAPAGRIRAAARTEDEARVGGSPLERARDAQSRATDDCIGAPAGGPGPRGRRPGGQSPGGGRPGARRRLLRVHRPQAVRADRYWRAVRPRASARGDAAVPGRRRHDQLGHLREDDVQRAALQVRGGDAEHRRRRGAGGGHGLRHRDRDGQTSPPTNATFSHTEQRRCRRCRG